MIRARLTTPHPQQGMALVEIMISITIGLILIAGVIQLFVSNKATYTLTEGQARVQENARFTMSILSRDLRMAGNAGCTNSNMLSYDTAGASVIPVENIVDNPPAFSVVNPETFITGINDAGVNALPGIVPGTDAITIQRASEASSQLAETMADKSADIQLIANAGQWQEDDILFISDCRHATIFRATGVAVDNVSGVVTIAHAVGAGGNTAIFPKMYEPDARVMTFVRNTYYIADTGRVNQAGEPIHSLYFRPNGGAPVELAEGVSDMQITYGENTNGGATATADTYVDADGVTNWRDVVSIRIALLVDSVENVAGQQQTYTFEGNEVIPNDRRLRRSFTTTISQRNRTS